MVTQSPEIHDMQPPLEAEGMPEAVQRFNPDQRRAFGSVPGLLGKELAIPAFEHLDQTALERVTPDGLRHGLLGPQTRHAVDGVVLNAEEYTAIVRSPASFQSAIQAKTIAASQGANPVRAVEKELKSGREAFRQKWKRQNLVLKGLSTERQHLLTLLEWQRAPGFSRTSEIDIVDLASQAYNGTITNMLRAYKDQHELTVEEHHDMTNALAFRLFRGPQKDRVTHWGETLQVATQYNNAKIAIFNNRQNNIVRFGSRLANDLNDFYTKHGIFEVK